ncbi:MAG: lipoprotein insertase outer membrane protein LolB [Pseudomonadales bacterium]
MKPCFPGKFFIRYRTLATTIAAILLLTACAQAPQQSIIVDNPNTFWAQHQQQAATLSNWNIMGKLGIRTAKQSNSARINWQQLNRVFDIRVTSLLGQGVVTLTGTTGNTHIKLAGHGEFNSGNPEALLLQELGWTLPIRALNYWVRGIPDPDNEALYQLNEQGLLDTLQQAGWQLSFSRYQTLDSHTLPSKIRLQQGEIALTLLIKRWSLSPDS